MVSVDGSLFIQIINFLILLYVMNRVLFKPIRKVLIERKGIVSDLEQTAGSLSEEALSKDKEYALGIKNARVEGVKQKDAFIEEASKEEKAILEKINKKALENLAEIRGQVEAEAEKARVALEKEVDVFAQEITEKILGRAC